MGTQKIYVDGAFTGIITQLFGLDAVRSVIDEWARYYKTKLKFLFKRSDQNLYVFFLETFLFDHIPHTQSLA